ncbi:MAG: glycosyltransferase family 4 protein, partial [Caulobacterales bacterium]|nr:glycosyltransferase family 4 protein [Caulobacterales bacterium]
AAYLARADAIARRRQDGPARPTTLAYLSGSSSHDRNFALMETQLLRLLRECADVKLLLVGPLTVSPEFRSFGDRFEHRDFIAYDTYADIFAEIDVNLVPLELTAPFCHGKSELKYIEAGACATPSVVSPTATFREVVAHGRNGLVVSGDEWGRAIRDLLDDPERARRMGEAARDHVLRDYAPAVRARELEHILQQAMRARTRDAASGPYQMVSRRVTLEMMRAYRALRRNVIDARDQMQRG